MQPRTEWIARGAVMTALALMLSYVESQIPFFFGMPGMKLGLTNVLVLFSLYVWGGRWAFGINVLRILLVGMLFSSPYSILYSLAGGIFSFFAMTGLKKSGFFSVSGVSVGGGIAHNTGQLLAALFLVENVNVLYYGPFLLLSGALTGALVGIPAGILVRRLGGKGGEQGRIV